MKKRSLFLTLLFAVISIALVACGGKTPDPVYPSDLPGTGVYYYDANDGEYLLTLNVGDTFSFTIKGETKSGTYILEGEALTLNFGKIKDKPEEAALNASLKDKVITLTYLGSQMRFLEKVDYDVTFDSKGGSSVDKISVRNGRTISKPSDPARSNFGFIGWYTDNACTDPFMFGTEAVTANTELYARWEQAGQREFTINFYSGDYTGAPSIASMKTIGGKLYNEPVLTRDGYAFCGWWISMFDKKDKLTTRLAVDTVFEENTTLFAVWQENVSGSKLSAPLVRIEDNTIRWDAIFGMSNYKIKITAPGNNVTVDTTQTLTYRDYNFSESSAVAGEYKIEVTAQHSNTDYTSDTTVRYFNNKVLSKVSLFEVVAPSTLLFNPVKNAVKYTIIVECGNTLHNHTSFDNGNSTFYNFANCPMGANGIKFTVTAEAKNGWLSSVAVFEYNRLLKEVSGLNYNETAQTLSWSAVPEATNYIVSVRDSSGYNTEVDNGSKTSYSLKEYALGDITVNVIPRTKGFNSPGATPHTFNKKILATPRNIRIDGNTIKWDTVGTGVTYDVKINGGTAIPITSGTSHTFTTPPTSDFELEIRAKGATESLWSDPLTVVTAMSELSYGQSLVSWNYVLGATNYQVMVNDIILEDENGDPRVITQNKTEITLTQSKSNTIKVRSFNGTNYSDWVNLNVLAHTITFDTRGGIFYDIDETESYCQYYATGDIVRLPEQAVNFLDKDGYYFKGWYMSAGGAASNGAQYIDRNFAENGDITLYAYWTSKTHSLTYDYDGGAGSGQKYSVTYDEHYKLEVPTINDGRGFVGWGTEKDNLDTRITDDFGVSYGVWDIPEDTTVYALWEELLVYTLNENGDAYSVAKKQSTIGLVKSVVIPPSYIYEGENEGDEPVELPVTEVYNFLDCKNLVLVKIPASVTHIDSGTFNGCTNLTTIDIDENNTVYYNKDGVVFKEYEYVDENEEDKIGIELVRYPAAMSGVSYIIPADVTTIGDNAFSGCTKLVSITFAGSVLATIGEYSFAGCTNLRSIPIPGSVKNLRSHAFQNCSSLKNVTIPAGIEVISTFAFAGCASLSSITIPESVKGIGANAFEGSGLTTITIPAAVTSLSANAFNNCKALEEIIFVERPATLTMDGRNVFSNCTSLTTVTFDSGCKVGNIGGDAFTGCTSLEEITIPDGVATIGSSAFDGCTNLESVSIPNSVTIINTQTFRNCVNLETVIFVGGGTNLATIQDTVFHNCESLESIILPSGLVTLNNSVFVGCTSLETVTFTGTGLTSIGQSCFSGCESLESITIPSSVESVGLTAFNGCISLETVTFAGSNLTSIGTETFKNCTNLISINIPASLQSFDLNIFTNCTSLDEINVDASNPNYSSDDKGVLFDKDKTQLRYYPRGKTGAYTTMPNSVTAISSSAFEGAKELSSVTISASVITIGSMAFQGCTELSLVTFAGNNLTTIGSNAFNGCTSLGAITIPASANSVSTSAFAGCTSLLTIDVAGGNSYVSLSGVLYTKDEKAIVCFPAGKSGTYAIPGSLTTIGNAAFKNSGITGIVIPNTITSIGESAFEGCVGLTSLEIPASVVSIGQSAFSGCIGLTSVSFTGTSQLNSIEGLAFYGCINLTEFTVPALLTSVSYNVFSGCSKLANIDVHADNQALSSNDGVLYSKDGKTLMYYPAGKPGISYTIPGGVKTISYNAFNSHTTLTEIVIPYSVTSLDMYAFANTKLTSVTFTGVSQLNSIGWYVFYSCKDLVSITIPAGVTTIGMSAFNSCSNLTTVTFAGNFLTTIGSNAFASCINLAKISIPGSVTTIESQAFYECTALTDITFLEGIAPLTLSGYVFFRCTDLEKITLPARLTTISGDCFNGLTGLKEVNFAPGSNLQSIGMNAFNNCTGIKVFVIPIGVTTINMMAFNGWQADQTIYVPEYPFGVPSGWAYWDFFCYAVIKLGEWPPT